MGRAMRSPRRRRHRPARTTGCRPRSPERRRSWSTSSGRSRPRGRSAGRAYARRVTCPYRRAPTCRHRVPRSPSISRRRPTGPVHPAAMRRAARTSRPGPWTLRGPRWHSRAGGQGRPGSEATADRRCGTRTPCRRSSDPRPTDLRAAACLNPSLVDSNEQGQRWSRLRLGARSSGASGSASVRRTSARAALQGAISSAHPLSEPWSRAEMNWRWKIRKMMSVGVRMSSDPHRSGTLVA